MQTRNQLKNSRDKCMDKNEDNIKNKLIRNVDVTNKTRNIKLAIYSLHSDAKKLNLKSISIAK